MLCFVGFGLFDELEQTAVLQFSAGRVEPTDQLSIDKDTRDSTMVVLLPKDVLDGFSIVHAVHFHGLEWLMETFKQCNSLLAPARQIK